MFLLFELNIQTFGQKRHLQPKICVCANQIIDFWIQHKIFVQKQPLNLLALTWVMKSTISAFFPYLMICRTFFRLVAMATDPKNELIEKHNLICTKSLYKYLYLISFPIHTLWKSTDVMLFVTISTQLNEDLTSWNNIMQRNFNFIQKTFFFSLKMYFFYLKYCF